VALCSKYICAVFCRRLLHLACVAVLRSVQRSRGPASERARETDSLILSADLKFLCIELISDFLDQFLCGVSCSSHVDFDRVAWTLTRWEDNNCRVHLVRFRQSFALEIRNYCLVSSGILPYYSAALLVSINRANRMDLRRKKPRRELLFSLWWR
jgi:hypothetical protein